MSRIRSKDTKPELLVRKYLFSRGLRFRVNVGRLPGHPDIVLAKYNALIEVRGCFWHRHEGCATATSPKSHVRFWREKFERNVARDRLHEEQWAAAGWRVFIVWECELRPFVREVTLAKLYAAIVGAPADGGVRGAGATIFYFTALIRAISWFAQAMAPSTEGRTGSNPF